MPNYFDKDAKSKIEKLNDALGMRHRTKPFDFNNAEDLEEVVKYSLCAYLDYHEFWIELDSLIERFDESMEHYSPDVYVELIQKSNLNEPDLIQAYNALGTAEQQFYRLSEDALDTFINILSMAFEATDDIQNKVFGKAYHYTKEELRERFDNLLMDGIDIEYQYNMEDAMEIFKKFLIEHF